MHISSYRYETAVSLIEAERHVAPWMDLMNRAAEDNVYMSPGFLLPVIRHLPLAHPYLLVFVYEKGGGRMIACAAFMRLPPSARAPFEVLSNFDSPHVNAAEPVLDRDAAVEALAALWDFLEDPRQPWRLILLNRISSQSPTWALLVSELRQRGRVSYVHDARRRPMLNRHASFEDYLASLPPSRRKGYRRRLRELSRAGRVEVHLHQHLDAVPDLAERYVELEQRSWKGKEGTALSSSPEHIRFFREVTHNMARTGQLFYVELRLDGRPIAMTSNYLHRSTFHASRVAYDEEFSAYSPGILTEIEGIRLLHEIPGLMVADSGSGESSYIRAYFRDSVDRLLVSVATSSLMSRAYVQALPHLFRLRDAARSRLPRLMPAAPRPIEAPVED